MTDDTPGSRLRASRQEAGLTTKELGRRAALAMGRNKPLSESAVRNQENGTNGIPWDVSAAYEAVLRLPQGFIQFGLGGPTDTGRVPIVGTVSDDWEDIHVSHIPDEEEYLDLRVKGFSTSELVAYRATGNLLDEYVSGPGYLIGCSAEMLAFTGGEMVVVHRQHEGRHQHRAMGILREGPTILLKPVLARYDADGEDIIFASSGVRRAKVTISEGIVAFYKAVTPEPGTVLKLPSDSFESLSPTTQGRAAQWIDRMSVDGKRQRK